MTRRNYMDTKDLNDIRPGDKVEFQYRGLQTTEPVEVSPSGGLLVGRIRFPNFGSLTITAHHPKPEPRLVTVDLGDAPQVAVGMAGPGREVWVQDGRPYDDITLVVEKIGGDENNYCKRAFTKDEARKLALALLHYTEEVPA